MRGGRRNSETLRLQGGKSPHLDPGVLFKGKCPEFLWEGEGWGQEVATTGSFNTWE